MKKIIIAILFAALSIAAFGQDYDYANLLLRLKAEDEFIIGDYHFYCVHYNKEKGGGDYRVQAGVNEGEELTMVRNFILQHKKEIEKKYDIYLSVNLIPSSLSSSSYTDGSHDFMKCLTIYKRKIYDEYQANEKAKEEQKKSAEAARLSSLDKITFNR